MKENLIQDNKRILRTYETYLRKVNEYDAKGYLVEAMDKDTYVQAYREIEAKDAAKGTQTPNKSAALAKESQIFSYQQMKNIKLSAARFSGVRERLQLQSQAAVNKMSLRNFMFHVRSLNVDRQDLWQICLDSNNGDYDAAKAMYNGLV